MLRISRLALGLAACAGLLSAGTSAGACEQDTDCKSGRTCINGACIAAPASMPAPAPPLDPAPPPEPTPPPTSSRSCERDGDCSLADVCQERRCVPFAQRKGQATSSEASTPRAVPSIPAAPRSSSSTALAEPSAPATPGASGAQGAAARVPYGKKGQIVPLGSLGFERTSYSYPDTSPVGSGTTTSRTTIDLSPGIVVFVADHVFIGARVGLSKVTTSTEGGSGSESTSLYVGPTLGFDAPFSDLVSLSLGGAIYYQTVSNASIDTSGTSSPKAGSTVLQAEFQAQLLFHVASHMFLGFGPYYARQLNKKITAEGAQDVDGTNLSFLGVSTVIGAWF